jgi:hypothetical protein
MISAQHCEAQLGEQQPIAGAGKQLAKLGVVRLLLLLGIGRLCFSIQSMQQAELAEQFSVHGGPLGVKLLKIWEKTLFKKLNN